MGRMSLTVSCAVFAYLIFSIAAAAQFEPPGGGGAGGGGSGASEETEPSGWSHDESVNNLLVTGSENYLHPKLVTTSRVGTNELEIWCVFIKQIPSGNMMGVALIDPSSGEPILDWNRDSIDDVDSSGLTIPNSALGQGAGEKYFSATSYGSRLFISFLHESGPGTQTIETLSLRSIEGAFVSRSSINDQVGKRSFPKVFGAGISAYVFYATSARSGIKFIAITPGEPFSAGNALGVSELADIGEINRFIVKDFYMPNQKQSFLLTIAATITTSKPHIRRAPGLEGETSLTQAQKLYTIPVNILGQIPSAWSAGLLEVTDTLHSPGPAAGFDAIVFKKDSNNAPEAILITYQQVDTATGDNRIYADALDTTGAFINTDFANPGKNKPLQIDPIASGNQTHPGAAVSSVSFQGGFLSNGIAFISYLKGSVPYINIIRVVNDQEGSYIERITGSSIRLVDITTSSSSPLSLHSVIFQSAAFIVWKDSQTNWVHAQKIKETGERLWGNSGKILSDVNSAKGPVSTLLDGVSVNVNLYAAWNDSRGGNQDIYGQLIDSSGNPGGALSTPESLEAEYIVTQDPAHGIKVTWSGELISGGYFEVQKSIDESFTTVATTSSNSFLDPGEGLTEDADNKYKVRSIFKQAASILSSAVAEKTPHVLAPLLHLELIELPSLIGRNTKALVVTVKIDSKNATSVVVEKKENDIDGFLAFPSSRKTGLNGPTMVEITDDDYLPRKIVEYRAFNEAGVRKSLRSNIVSTASIPVEGSRFGSSGDDGSGISLNINSPGAGAGGSSRSSKRGCKMSIEHKTRHHVTIVIISMAMLITLMVHWGFVIHGVIYTGDRTP